MTLEERREVCEKDLMVRMELSDEVTRYPLISCFLVVLEVDISGPKVYNCHRYLVDDGKNWVCSVDKQKVTINEVFKWIEKFTSAKSGPFT